LANFLWKVTSRALGKHLILFIYTDLGTRILLSCELLHSLVILSCKAPYVSACIMMHGFGFAMYTILPKIMIYHEVSRLSRYFWSCHIFLQASHASECEQNLLCDSIENFDESLSTLNQWAYMFTRM
jgi:hypothetical protein